MKVNQVKHHLSPTRLTNFALNHQNATPLMSPGQRSIDRHRQLSGKGEPEAVDCKQKAGLGGAVQLLITATQY